MQKVVVLGTGPAGLTAAIYLARANMNPLVIEGNEPGGQLTLTTEVENFPGFPEGIMGPELMQNMRKQAERFGATFQRGWVTKVDLTKRPFTLTIDGSEQIQTESLIVSTGASAKLLEIPGEKENIGRGVSTCATCDGFFFRGKKVIIVGGGDSAMEEANFLTRFATEVRVVHRRSELRASKIMQDRARNNPKITWSLNCTPIEVIAGEKGVTGLKVKHNDTGTEEIIETEGIFVAIGHRPNTAFLQGQIKTDETGYIVVTPGTTETNIPGVFACGDVQDHRYRQAITAAGTGCMAALDCEKFLEENAVHDWSITEPKSYQALVDDNIFFGGAADVDSMIEKEGVEVVVDLRGEAEQPAFSNPDVQWIQIALGDNANTNQDVLFKRAIDEVVNAYKSGKKVAFHCNGGRGRTGAVAAGVHLTLGLSTTLQEAEEKVKDNSSRSQHQTCTKRSFGKVVWSMMGLSSCGETRKSYIFFVPVIRAAVRWQRASPTWREQDQSRPRRRSRYAPHQYIGWTNQVVAGLRLNAKTVLEPVADRFPDILEDMDEVAPSELACSQMIASEPQRLITNRFAAQAVAVYLNELFGESSLSTHVTFFHAKKLYMRGERIVDG